MRQITNKQLKAIHNMLSWIKKADCNYLTKKDYREYDRISESYQNHRLLKLNSTDQETQKIFSDLLQMIKEIEWGNEIMSWNDPASDGI